MSAYALLAALTLAAGPAAPTPALAPTPAPADFTRWDALLKAHVSEKGVDYAGLGKKFQELEDIVGLVGKATGAQPLSFYLNAYNALVLSSVVELARPPSVLEVKGFFDARKHVVGGKSLTLNDLENQIRERFKDPRIHFALNCASKSCPPLQARAFDEKTLNADLDALTQRFIDGPGVLPDGDGAVKVSKVFEWYAKDFLAQGGSVEGYLRKWVREPSRKKALEGAKVTVRFQDYNWSLNVAR